LRSRGCCRRVSRRGSGRERHGRQGRWQDWRAADVGLSTAALDFLAGEAEKRADLREPLASLRDELDQARADLLALAEGDSSCTSESVRTQANSLVLRSTQAALAAAKGTGYVIGHPAGRWCREALFFLVWSCPQPVMAANLCELAGL
jgi:hypothetical protein